ncbi:hypothetical protein, partial [Rickettsia endosymbiont of Culicoides newsteadi]|uniref:hypothetical protein n=1 Tax=Rickettsia endosymbiont of Culicoides newsteadi TaxID=1961830 RepID=UPI001957FAF0
LLFLLSFFLLIFSYYFILIRKLLTLFFFCPFSSVHYSELPNGLEPFGNSLKLRTTTILWKK